MANNVDHPSHYQMKNGLEAIDIIDSVVNAEDFAIGNCLKYLIRWKDKNGLEDLKKAQWYLNHAIDIVKKKNSR